MSDTIQDYLDEAWSAFEEGDFEGALAIMNAVLCRVIEFKNDMEGFIILARGEESEG